MALRLRCPCALQVYHSCLALGTAPKGARIMPRPSALRSGRLPVNLIGSPINYANRSIGSPITSQSTAETNPSAAPLLRSHRSCGKRRTWCCCDRGSHLACCPMAGDRAFPAAGRRGRLPILHLRPGVWRRLRRAQHVRAAPLPALPRSAVGRLFQE